jgi:tetratricopeptide (TPR) repeat protein
MNSNNKWFIKYILVLAVASAGCKKSFIELSDPTRMNTSNYITTADGLNTAINATYGTLQPIYNGAIQLFGDVASDNTTTQTGGVGMHVVDRFIYDASFVSFSTFWNISYRSIAQCNVVLSRGPSVTMDATLQARYLAEAKFIRALSYFNLVRIYGDVPLITKELADYKDAYSYGRQPVKDVYDQIVKDLTEAAAALPATYVKSDVGRVTSGAANSILGKVYLTQGKYTEAANILAQVIQSNTYSLLSDYASVFSTSSEMNSEIIFAVRYVRGGLSLGSGFGGSMIPTNSGTTILKAGAAAGGVNDEMPEFANLFSDQDKRKAISVGYFANGAPTAYYSLKFLDQAATAPGDAENDWIVIRYADVLLMHAEALNALARTSEAEPYLNQVRTRAGLASITGLSQADFALAIENERRLELSLEGHRWFDLVRTGRALTVMNAHFAANAAFYGTTYSVKQNQLLFPIPLTEIQTNPKLTQNPGY